VVHRDIKPDNVLLSGGTAVVTDFGIAKALSASRSGGDSATLTQLGTSIGTPAYMAPEQAAGDPDVDHRADIYAFGCMAYELLAGQPPFHDRTPQRVLAAHLGETPRDVTALRADTPPALADLVMRSLAKDAAARPQGAAELMQVLDAATSGGTMPAMPLALLGGAGMLKRALLVYAVALVLVALVARTAIVVIGLPTWVLPGTLIVMALGLPVILFTAYSHHVTKRLLTATPMSWRRTTLGGIAAVGTLIIVVSGFMVLRAMGIGPFGSLLAAGKLELRQPLLMTDFHVVSADSTLGGVLAQAVRSNLEQSSAITLVPQSAVTQALQRMEWPAARIDLALAQEIAAREGLKAIVDGEVAGIGSGFLLTLRLVSADSARELTSFRQGADGPTELIAAVDALSRKLRGKIGESLKTVQGSPPLAQVTTASIDALRKYTEATRATGRLDFTTAAALAREAVAIDTGFALAWRHLAESLNTAGLPGGDSAITRAYQRRDRLTERERLTVTAEYYAIGAGQDRAKAIEAYRAQVELGEYGNTNSLGILYLSRRDFARADSFGRLRLKVEPDYRLTYNNVSYWRLLSGQMAAAESVVTQARERFPGWDGIPYMEAYLWWVRDSIGRAERLLDSLQRIHVGDMRTADLVDLQGLALQGGRLGEARRRSEEYHKVDAARGAMPTPVIDSLDAIWTELWFRATSGDPVTRIDAVVAAAGRLGTETDRSNAGPSFRARGGVPVWQLDAAVAYALAGNADNARAMVGRYDADVRDTVLRRVDSPARNRALAEIALAAGRPGEAVIAFRKADSLLDGPAGPCSGCLHGNLVRAWDAAGEPDSTIAVAERYFDTPVMARPTTIFDAPIAKRLGEMYEERGDRARAAAYYQKFLQTWKDADPVLQPLVNEVRRKLARLRDIEPLRSP
jgi:tetratricopeptide (TPR) repeat protein